MLSNNPQKSYSPAKQVTCPGNCTPKFSPHSIPDNILEHVHLILPDNVVCGSFSNESMYKPRTFDASCCMECS